MLGQSLDDERPVQRDGWLLIPLISRGSSASSVLVAQFSQAVPDRLLARAAAVGDWLQSARRVLQRIDGHARRVDRAQRMLDIVAQWEQARDMDQLLERMAAAATDLLGAERASIFLWDRANKTLVGRPALGVEDGELRIPDSAGVVGQVVQSGKPHRVGRSQGQEEIDRRVDQQLGFKTRTLLCVPLIGRSGERFGAFELINKLAGDFGEEDEAALTDLAQHAAVALENTQHLEKLLRSRRQLVDEAAAGLQLIGQCPAITALRSTGGFMAAPGVTPPGHIDATPKPR